jgi:uncharacterized membrane protein YkoI
MHTTTRKLLVAVAFAAAVAAGAGVAAAAAGPGESAGPGDDEPAVAGDALARASAAALQAAGRYGPGGTVTEAEGPGEHPGYEVEVTLADGTEVEVDLDASFAVVGIPEVEAPDD